MKVREPPKNTPCRRSGCKSIATLTGWYYVLKKDKKWKIGQRGCTYKRYEHVCDQHFAEGMLGLLKFDCKYCEKYWRGRYKARRAPKGAVRKLWIENLIEGRWSTYVDIGSALRDKQKIHCGFCGRKIRTTRWVPVRKPKGRAK